MKIVDIFEAKTKKPMPKMMYPGVKVSMLERWRSKLEKAIVELGHAVEQAGYEEGSTVWSVTFEINKKFNIDEFEDKLREKLNFDGWLRVNFFDMVEE